MAKNIIDKLKRAGVAAGRGVVTYIDPAALTIITGVAHPLYDPRVDLPLDEAFLHDIMARGVLQPVVCRENGMVNGVPVIQVIAGRRRVMHLIEANRRRRKKRQEPAKIPVLFAHGSDAEMLLIAIAENAHRKNESVASLAWKVRAARSLTSLDEVVKACGMSPKRVTSLLRFNNLTDAAQHAIDSGEIPFGSIDVLADVPREEQDALLQKLKESGATKNHEVQDAVLAHQNGQTYVPLDRKKVWGRRELKLLKKELAFHDKRSKEIQVAIALVDFILGDNKTLTNFVSLKLAVTTVRQQLARQLKKEEKEAKTDTQEAAP